MAIKSITIGSMKNIFSYDDSLVTVALEIPGPIKQTSAATLPEHLVRKEEADAEYGSSSALTSHVNNTDNPHSVTLTQAADLTETPISGTFQTGSTVPGTLSELIIENGIIVGATLVP